MSDNEEDRDLRRFNPSMHPNKVEGKKKEALKLRQEWGKIQ